MSLLSQTPDRPYLPFRGVKNDDTAFLPLNSGLREIRCVILLPGSGDDPIECELVYTNIDEKSDDRTPYVALSYCWGAVEDTVEIQLYSPSTSPSSARKEPTRAPFRITQNLFVALQALRNEKRQCLWIDALCINQQDPREKTHQVQLMGKIYSSAESVVVWLG
ncbi:heterokaryon incompatibility protein-domain-containing protein, partial [Alternaria rosae]|uniref:heterokaryon incompatibility protein-domain-containing protein n=1 Tax=Alternaria rosae TaxID=1187941 RepID=UPI001E8E5E2A